MLPVDALTGIYSGQYAKDVHDTSVSESVRPPVVSRLERYVSADIFDLDAKVCGLAVA